MFTGLTIENFKCFGDAPPGDHLGPPRQTWMAARNRLRGLVASPHGGRAPLPAAPLCVTSWPVMSLTGRHTRCTMHHKRVEIGRSCTADEDRSARRSFERERGGR